MGHLLTVEPQRSGSLQPLEFSPQAKPQAKNSSLQTFVVNSRSMFDGTVTATDMDRATDAREKGRIGIIGSAQAYAGSSGRVTSERIGRDLNPLGRGDGNAYVGGAQNLGQIYPVLPKSSAQPGWGNSVNNGCCDGGGGTSFSPSQNPGIAPPYLPPPDGVSWWTSLRNLEGRDCGEVLDSGNLDLVKSEASRFSTICPPPRGSEIFGVGAIIPFEEAGTVGGIKEHCDAIVLQLREKMSACIYNAYQALLGYCDFACYALLSLMSIRFTIQLRKDEIEQLRSDYEYCVAREKHECELQFQRDVGTCRESYEQCIKTSPPLQCLAQLRGCMTIATAAKLTCLKNVPAQCKYILDQIASVEEEIKTLKEQESAALGYFDSMMTNAELRNEQFIEKVKSCLKSTRTLAEDYPECNIHVWSIVETI